MHLLKGTYRFDLGQELLDNTARLREQMAEARMQAEREQQEDYLKMKQMEAYEQR